MTAEKPTEIGFTTHDGQPYVCIADLAAWLKRQDWNYETDPPLNGVRDWIIEEITLMALAHSSEVSDAHPGD